MAQVQWFPGHMAKARREMSERMKWVDMIIELVDARAPYSSKNPMIDEISKNKPRLVVLTKNDMADEKRTREWIEYYESLGYKAISVNLKRFREYQKIISECRNILKDKMEKERQRGMQPRAIRAIVVGIPNVGKSTFINSLAGKKAAITGNKPGVTKSQQLIRVDKDFELFDTPGVLWPKFEDERIARNIAFLGSIKQTILPLDELFIEAMKYMNVHYPDLLKARYVVITNTARWLDTYDTFYNLKNAYSDVLILPTDYQKYIFSIDEEIKYEEIREDSLFITLKKD